MFYCEFCEISKNTFFTKHSRATASEETKMLKRHTIQVINRSSRTHMFLCTVSGPESFLKKYDSIACVFLLILKTFLNSFFTEQHQTTAPRLTFIPILRANESTKVSKWRHFKVNTIWHTWAVIFWDKQLHYYRNKCSVKKAVMEKLSNFLRKRPWWSLFLLKFLVRTCNIILKRTSWQVLFCNFYEIFQKGHSTEHLRTVAFNGFSCWIIFVFTLFIKFSKIANINAFG